MDCPYLEDVVMVFCRAYPVRKLVPRNRLAASGPCQGPGFEGCPLYRELLSREAAAGAAVETDPTLSSSEKEISQ